MIPTFTRAYEAAAEIDGNVIVTYAAPAAGKTVTTAADGTVPLVGVADAMGAPIGGMCDVHRGGLVSVRLGGTVSAGDPITADADGLGVEAAPASGDSVFIVGFADEPGGADDIIDVFFAPGTITG
ncbi:hypothetical protein [Paracoccus denitrificans]|uniref:hypothetical protein n=1 Tax=Paracoccus denitrificans TaxID=266 RepID=UPI003364C719